MRKPLVPAVLGVCLAVASLALFGCSVSEEVLQDSEKRMNELMAKGMPDSALSKVKVYLFEAQDAKERNEGSRARKAADSLLMALEEAETEYAEHVQTLPPVIDSLVAAASEQAAELTGLQAKKVDSLKAVIDSLTQASRPVSAVAAARDLVAYMPQLLEDEKTAKKLSKRVPGVWTCINKKTSKVHPQINAVEKKVFTFKRDGKATFVESETGQGEKTLKKNYRFISYGTYGLAGDTIKLSVNRFVSEKQEFHILKTKADGKTTYWEKEQGPVYDSLITDGSQDRYITLGDLEEDFRQTKRY